MCKIPTFPFLALSGVATGKSSCFFFFIHVSTITLCLYGFLSGIVRKTEVLMQTISLGIAILANVWQYYLVCNTAHKVYLNVRFQQCLLNSASSM
jgi:hypothetical protein